MNFKRMVSAFCNGKDLINTYKMDPRANMAPRDVKVLILSLTEGETHHRLKSATTNPLSSSRHVTFFARSAAEMAL